MQKLQFFRFVASVFRSCFPHGFRAVGQRQHGFRAALQHAHGFRAALQRAPAICLAAALCLAALLCLTPAPAGAESIVWYGPDDPRNTGSLQSDPTRPSLSSLFPTGASGNTVAVHGDVPNVSGGYGNVYGGLDYRSSSGTASAQADNNSLSIFGGTMGTVYGGHATANAPGGDSTASAQADNNSLNIFGGTMDSVYGGYATANASGGDSTASAQADNNSLSIFGGTMGSVYGGYAWAEASGGDSAQADNNSLSIFGGTMGSVYGGRAYVSANSSAQTDNNSLSIFGGTMGNVYGGYAYVSSGGNSASAQADNNSLNIFGGTMGTVYGGYAYASSGGNSASAQANNNSLTLSGAPVFTGSSSLYGGYNGGNVATYDVFTGNVLRLWNYQGRSTLDTVANFELYDFILPANITDTGVLLRASIVTFGGNSGNLSGGASPSSRITSLNIMGGGRAPQDGEAMALLKADSGGMTGDIEYNGVSISKGGTPAIQGMKGIALLYNFRLSQKDDALIATVDGPPRVNPRLKALNEGRAAGLAFVSQGADLIAGQGIQAALAATRAMGGAGTARASGDPAADQASGSTGAAQASGGLVAFGAAQGGGSRYQTGSHVDVDGFSLLAGLGSSFGTAYGDLLLAAFFEAGWGNYDSHNSFNSLASVSGSGDMRYHGGGLLGRFDFSESGTGRAYTEASLRAGWSETDFSSSDLRDATGERAQYDSGAAYYGAHAGLGYILKLSDVDSLDLSLKYFWTRQQGDSVRISTGDPVRFKAADSHRARAGARYGHDFVLDSGALLTPYVGAAYEHEFDGRARATTYGYSIDAPELEGGTGVGEIGVRFAPVARYGLSLGLGVQGYTGQREGVTGSFALRFEW